MVCGDHSIGYSIRDRFILRCRLVRRSKPYSRNSSSYPDFNRRLSVYSTVGILLHSGGDSHTTSV